MKRGAKDALGQALNEEQLHVEDVGELFVGNPRGLNLLTRLRELDEIPSLTDRIVSRETNNISLEDRVSSLTSSLDAYSLLRSVIGPPPSHHSKSFQESIQVNLTRDVRKTK
jgi:hypothetical protein